MSERSPAGRPRPVAEAPVAALAADAPGLAKEWLIALIASAPLAAAQRLPVDDLVRQAPVLCGEIARALASDLELERLSPGGDLAALARRAGTMAGAVLPEDCVAAVEILRTIIWRRVLGELRDPEPALVGELASRLAHVCSVVAAACVVTAPRRGAPEPTARAGGSSASQAQPTAPAAPPPGRVPAEVGERAAGPRRPPPTAAVPMRPPLAPPAARTPTAQPAPPDSGAVAGARPAGNRSVNGEGPTSWIGSIGRRLERFEEDGLPFAVLLIEVTDIDRLRRAESEPEIAHLVGQVERAVSGELRPADLLTRESLGRYWLVTPETDGEGALTLAGRLAGAVEAGASHRGAPLRVAIGIATCPQDGREPAALAARADIGLYTARSTGRSVVTVEDLP